jgi:CDP-glucose 4,6-dehydratase
MAAAVWTDAYRDRRVLVTGHTGFKGGWLALWLNALGARVTGYALAPATEPNLFTAARVGEYVQHNVGDVRDPARLSEVWTEARPEIVFHMAAQPLVRESYRDPLATLETNFNGTAHVLELARRVSAPLALVVVTSDKCYENREWVYGYREDDAMGGHDVYSMSKGAAELLVSSYRRSFFQDAASPVALATARAGNVMGGGDWSAERIVPDCVRSLTADTTERAIEVRNPRAVRPWQHVLEPLSGYLQLGARLLSRDAAERRRFSEAWNFGPEVGNTRTVGELVESFVARWGAGSWRDASDANAPHEASLLRLSIDKAHARLGWSPRWDFDETVARTVGWYKAFYAGEDAGEWCLRQINDYCGGTLEAAG